MCNMNKESSKILMKFLTVCSENKLAFTYQNSVEKNYVEFNGKEVLVNIYDFEDPNLKKYLEEKFTELFPTTPL